MPAITVTGLGSGIQSDEIIQKLKDVERQPIVKLERERQTISYEIEALKELRTRTKKLQATLKALYGFDSALSKNKLLSYPQGYIDGMLTGAAKEGKHDIQMSRLASKLSITSRTLKLKEELPAATIILSGADEKNVVKEKFQGGSNIDFVNFLNENFSDYLRSRLVQINKDFMVIAIDGKKDGKQGLLRFGDPDGLLTNLELINPNLSVQEEPKEEQEDKDDKEKKKDEIDFPLLFTGDKLWVVQDGHMQIKEQNTVLELGDKAARRMEIKKEDKQKNLRLTALAVRAYLQENTAEAENTTPYSLKDGPSQKATIAGVELNTYNITRTRPLDIKKQEYYDYGVVLHYKKPKFPGQEATENENNFIEKISFKGKQLERIAVKPGLVAVDFYTDNAKVQFSNVRTIYEIGAPVVATPVEDNEEDPDIALQRLMFPHLVKPAVNAVFTFDGVRVEREKNKDIMDLIPGATINLLAYTNQNIEFEITRDVENAVQKIKAFVEAHNDLLVFTQQVAKKNRNVKMPNEYKKLKEEMGILASNTTVRNLMDGLNEKIFSIYYTLDNKDIRVISALGIGSGEDRGEWKDLEGKLKVNETVLREALMAHPEEVENFFAYDQNGDFRFDSGMAFSTYKFLEPYGRKTGGLITAQITSKSDRITSLKKEIARIEKHVEDYEENLKKKFGYMDSVVRQQKSTGQFLKNKFGNKN